MNVEVADGFELGAGTEQTATFAANGVALFSGVVTATVQTGGGKNGSGFGRVAPTVSAAGRFSKSLSGGQISATGSKCWSVYVRFPSGGFPATNGNVLRCGITATCSVQYDVASGKLGLFHSASGGVTVFGPVISADTWYLVDWKVDMSGTTHTQTARVNGDAGTEGVRTQPTQTAQNPTDCTLGTTGVAGPAYTCDYDDWIITDSAADYPIGEHVVRLLRPSADGSHNAGTNIMENASGADIGTVTAFDLINTAFNDTSTYIRQNASGASNYAEVLFEDLVAGDTVLGVLVTASIRAETGGTADALVRAVDSSNATLTDSGGSLAASGTTIRYSSKICAVPSGGAWDATKVNGIKGRMGFATDVVPQPQYLGMGLYVAVQPSVGGPAPPGNLVATAVSTSQINLTWNTVAGATGYDIERDGAVIVFDHPTNSYSDTGRSPATSYTYRVRAVL